MSGFQRGGAHVEPALLSWVDRAARGLRLPDLPLDAGELMAAAERRAGRSFRTREVETALAAAIDACEHEADLSLFGRFSFQWDALRRLQTLLRASRLLALLPPPRRSWEVMRPYPDPRERRLDMAVEPLQGAAAALALTSGAPSRPPSPSPNPSSSSPAIRRPNTTALNQAEPGAAFASAGSLS